MKALILAAGLGSRLKHKTEDRPKALTIVAGSTILQYQLLALQKAKISHIGIVLGYQGDKIVEFVRMVFPSLKVSYFWNHDYRESNSSYSFWTAREWVIGEPYLHLNCDILFSQNLLNRLLTSSAFNILSIRKDVPLGDKMENVVLQGDRIVAMSLTRRSESTAKAFGLGKFSSQSTNLILQKIKKRIDQGDRNEHYYGLIREAVHHLDYRALDAGEDLLLEVNTLDDLARAEKILSERAKKA